jgi:WD40 repeat protein
LDAQRVGAVADDWTCAAVIRDDNGISMVSLDDGRELAGRDSYGAAIDAVAICPSNQLAAVALQEQGLRIWDWRQAVDLETSARAIRPRTMRFSSTGALLAIVDDQDRRMVHVLNLSAPADSPRTFPHEAEVTSACLHPGDSFLLTTGSDYGVRVWSLEPGDLVAEFKHDADVITARFSPDGRYVLSAGGRSDRTARLWIWRPEDLVAEACGRISRDLTQEEWDQYLGEEPYRRTRELADDVNTEALS